VQIAFRAVGFAALGLVAGTVVTAQDLPAISQPDRTKQNSGATLKVSLRLQDETPFVGLANVRLVPTVGDEILSTRSEMQSDYLFFAVEPGKYSLKISAPGYLPTRSSTEVQAGSGQRTLFVPMKPRLVPNEDLTGEESNTGLAAVKRTSPGPKPDYWRPHKLEEVVPPVDPSTACPAEEVLRGVGQRMGEFVSTLEKFTAVEQVEHYTVDHTGAEKKLERRTFVYLVTVTRNHETFLLDEYRNGSTAAAQFPQNIATEGLSAIDLIFHPLLANDFDFRCEGLGRWEGRELWQVHFVQRSDRPMRMREYMVNGRYFGLKLEGRAWIDPGNDEVVHLESELAKPVPQIELTREHLVVTYAPVKFVSTGQELWLPHEAELYVERRGKRYFRRHTFSDFRLFNVDTLQTLQQPKSSYSFTNVAD
jgi:hypothetical protein